MNSVSTGEVSKMTTISSKEALTEVLSVAHVAERLCAEQKRCNRVEASSQMRQSLTRWHAVNNWEKGQFGLPAI